MSERKIVYFGKRRRMTGGHPVYRHDLVGEEMPQELPIEASQRLVGHSDGYQWGYGGGAPALLAHSLLLDATEGDEEKAGENYQRFKEVFVSKFGGWWTIERATILKWLEYRTSGEESGEESGENRHERR